MSATIRRYGQCFFMLLLILAAWSPASQAKPVSPRLGSPDNSSRLDDETKQADIIVFGATSAGVVAAVQASRMGKSVLLLEPHDHIGGLTTGGLGATDIGNKNVIGGLSREFYQRVARHYQKDSSWKHETREEFFASRSKRTKLSEVVAKDGTMWTFEPSVAKNIFQQMLQEAGVVVVQQQKLKRVVLDGTRIKQIEVADGNIYTAKMFIDATYEGDLMAMAKVRYRVGREANSEYNETLNGIRGKTPKNQIYGGIDPYTVPGDSTSGLIPLIQDGDGGIAGQADHRVQAYNFRLCFTDVAANRLPLAPPQNYDPARYELAARRCEKIVNSDVAPQLRHFCNPVWMPNRKTDINNSQGISTDFIGANYEYPDADYDKRAKIWQAHEDYVRGFWHFMSTSDRIAESLREQFKKFGPCRDEFQTADGWSAQLYVREARRMVSSYVMTEHNCRGNLVAKDSIGMAAYGMDSHNCQRIVKNGVARNEGDVQVHGLRPYPVSFRSIVPEKQQCENLLVPVCLSATHIAFGSIRMEPVFMVLGQSSAISASLAIDEKVAVQDIKYQQLRPMLLAAGQVLKRPGSGNTKRTGSAAWTNGTGNQSWHEPENWNAGTCPKKLDSVVVDRAEKSLALISKDVAANLGSICVGSEGGQVGQLQISDGKVEATSISTRKTRVGLRGGNGTVHQSGGAVTLNSLQISLDAQSKGVYHLSGGSLRLKRQIDQSVGSLAVGDNNPEGTGTFVISGGSLQTHSGVTLGHKNGHASFVVQGSAADSINIGTKSKQLGFWKQGTGDTLAVEIDQQGVCPIRIHGSSDAANVTFEKNSLIHPSFAGQPQSGSWDILKWNGAAVDQGLILDPNADSDLWSFEFVDTDQSGEPDVLRLTYTAEN